MPKKTRKTAAFRNCIKNALERQGYVSFALAKSLEDARSPEEALMLRDLMGASNLIADRLKSL